MNKNAPVEPKRRLGPRDVTLNACTECRKKRSKCDGRKPCGRCAGQRVECTYQVPVRFSKEHMRKELEQLKQNKVRHEKLLTALISHDSSDFVLDQLRSGTSLEKLDEALTKTKWPVGASFGQKPKDENWTSVTSDAVWIDHLIALYFCWEYPIFAPLSKDHFMDDYKSGRQRYCTSLLVNAILAVGCRFSLQSKARGKSKDSIPAGDQFFAEAVRLLSQEINRYSFTTIQSLGLMSIRQASCDQLQDSLFYADQSIRLAVEMGLHNDMKPDHKVEAEYIVRSATFWGAFSLNEAWSLSLQKLPHFSENITSLKKPESFQHADTSWSPCIEENDLPCETKPQQMSNIKSVFLAFCGLSEVVHGSQYSIYSSVKEVTSSILLANYNNYLQWYDNIPTNLRHGQDFTPAVLFLHIYYHFAILLLFRPFISHEITFSSVSPLAVCNQAANAIVNLTRSYSRLYSLARTPVFLPYCILTSTLTNVVILGDSEDSLNLIGQGFADLKQASSCHCFPERALNILRFSSKMSYLKLAEHHDNRRRSLTNSEEQDKNEVWRNITPFDVNQFDLELPQVTNMDTVGTNNPSPLHENSLFWSSQPQPQPLNGLKDEKIERLGFTLKKTNTESGLKQDQPR